MPPDKSIAFFARAGYAARGVVYLLIGGLATLSALGRGGQTTGSQGALERLLSAPLGEILLGAKAKFERHFCMPQTTQRWAYPICRFGLVVRGLVFIVTGTFFIIAAYQVNPDEAGGIAEVFSTFRKQPFGTPLMAFIAVGLFAFGMYSMLEAFYRRVDPS